MHRQRAGVVRRRYRRVRHSLERARHHAHRDGTAHLTGHVAGKAANQAEVSGRRNSKAQRNSGDDRLSHQATWQYHRREEA